jgi:hypothetical protein
MSASSVYMIFDLLNLCTHMHTHKTDMADHSLMILRTAPAVSYYALQNVLEASWLVASAGMGTSNSDITRHGTGALFPNCDSASIFPVLYEVNASTSLYHSIGHISETLYSIIFILRQPLYSS